MENGETIKDTAKEFLKIIETSGSIEANLSTIRLMASASIVGQVVIPTRDGSATRGNLVLVVTFGVLMEVNTQATGRTIRRTVSESTYTPTKVSTSVTITMIDQMGLAYTNGRMETFTRENGKTGSEVALECSNGRGTKQVTLESSKRIP